MRLLLCALCFAGCTHGDGTPPRRTTPWPAIYGCVDPYALGCATPGVRP